MTALTKDELIQLRSLTEEMIIQAKESNWQAVNRLDSQRRALLRYNPEELPGRRVQKKNSHNANDLESVFEADSENAGYFHKMCQEKTESANNSNMPQQKQQHEDVIQNKAIRTEHSVLIDDIYELDHQLLMTIKNVRNNLVQQNRHLSEQLEAQRGYAAMTRSII